MCRGNIRMSGLHNFYLGLLVNIKHFGRFDGNKTNLFLYNCSYIVGYGLRLFITHVLFFFFCVGSHTSCLLVYFTLYVTCQGVREQCVVHQDSLSSRSARNGQTGSRASELGPNTEAL